MRQYHSESTELYVIYQGCEPARCRIASPLQLFKSPEPHTYSLNLTKES